MALRPAAVARELHFTASLLLALLLIFFAVTGFVAQHREWFHPRIDRSDLSARHALPGPCAPETLATAAGVGSGAVVAADGLLVVDAGEARLACRPGADHHFVGRSEALPPEAPSDPTELRRWAARTWDLPQPRTDPGAPPRLEGGTVWQDVRVDLEPEARRVVVWQRPLPLAYGLVELHRGRGRTDVLVDVTAFATVLVAVTGVLHGLRYPGRRRRLLVGLLLASAVLLGALLAG